MITISVLVTRNIRIVASPTHVTVKVGQSGTVTLTAFDDGAGGVQVPVPPNTVSSDNPLVAAVSQISNEAFVISGVDVGSTNIQVQE